MKNENINKDMKSILQHFFSYLAQTGDGGVDCQLFSRDQLTIERAVNVISSVANVYTLQGWLVVVAVAAAVATAAVAVVVLLFIIMAISITTQLYSRFFSGKSDEDSCTLLFRPYTH